jgi:hypothetical protein
MLGGAVIVAVSIFGIYGAATGRLAAMLAAILDPNVLQQVAPSPTKLGPAKLGPGIEGSNLHDILSTSGNPTRSTAQGPYATKALAQTAAKGNPEVIIRKINDQWYIVNPTAGIMVGH